MVLAFQIKKTKGKGGAVGEKGKERKQDNDINEKKCDMNENKQWKNKRTNYIPVI